jgi:hypothetical protein
LVVDRNVGKLEACMSGIHMSVLIFDLSV